MIADLKAAGLIKSIPKKGVLSASHVDTVFRTNVLNSYNYGRYKHASQPKVIKAFPVWEIVSVVDGRERSAHAAANGKMLLATDPFWKRAYPPFGFNCRCRIISRSAKYLSQVVSGSTITGLPDSGFTSGYSALIAA
jgi:SPP1 gp7 family putative phage head morphogenesis protein